MLRFLQLFFISLLVSSTAWSSPVIDGPAAEVDTGASKSSFQELLSSVNAISVHLALHALSGKYRDGVFPTPANAVEALHKENASLATQVLKLARRHKHSNNTTTSASHQSSSTSMTTSQTSSSSSTSTSTSASISTTTTTPPSTSTTPTTSASPSSTSSTSMVPSTTTSSTTAQTTFSTSAAMTTSSSTSANITPFTSTYHSTTTLSNGELSTVTAVTVVYPTPTAAGTSAGASATPGLQTGNAVALNSQGLTKEILAMLGGAVVVAMAL